MDNLILRTPLISHQNNLQNIFLKPENLQPFGSYKIRGVLAAIQSADESQLKIGITAASAGNMAQAVAFLAQQLKINCQIFVPDSAPEIKKLAIKKMGAKLVEIPFSEVWEMVRNPKPIPGFFIHPVFTPGLLEGYGTIADEILTDRPSLQAVVIPFGVGGLTLGVARRFKKLKPEIKIYCCEPETAAPLKASLIAGKASQVQRIPSFVDAIGTPEVLEEVFQLARDIVEDSIVVPLSQIQNAMKNLLVSNKLVCEGAAATSLAAAQQLIQKNPKLEIACILTGGNVPTDLIRNLF